MGDIDYYLSSFVLNTAGHCCGRALIKVGKELTHRQGGYEGGLCGARPLGSLRQQQQGEGSELAALRCNAAHKLMVLCVCMHEHTYVFKLTFPVLQRSSM